MSPASGKPLRDALDPLVENQRASGSGTSTGHRNQHQTSKLDILSKTLLSPFSYHRPDPSKIISDLAPVIMNPRILSAANTPRNSRGLISASGHYNPSPLEILTRRLTSNPAANAVADSILDLEVPAEQVDGPSLLRGYQATIPSSSKSKSRRRDVRAHAAEHDRALSSKSKRLGRTTMTLPQEELSRQTNEIVLDKENIQIRRAVIGGEIEEVQRKIDQLHLVREKLEAELLKLTEDELELDDELDGILNTLSTTTTRPANLSRSSYTNSQRRRKGPAFLPSEHDNLPHGVAFMTLAHPHPIQALDFSAPYEILISSSSDSSSEDYSLHIWDLSNGTETRRLSGHKGAVRAIQVDDNLCLTGGDDGCLRVWDLRRVNGDWEEVGSSVGGAVEVVEEVTDEFGRMNWSNVHSVDVVENITPPTPREEDSACLRVLEGHSRGINSLYFENECLVTGASDKTIRQWDLNTGQCVMTMDILWAMSESSASTSVSTSSKSKRPSKGRQSFSYRHDLLPFSEMDYPSFVGGLQFWGYALISGSADGAVRMWDMRTGQPHRTLLGHTAPITCLQFDETHVVTGSQDKSIRIWDLRTGTTSDTLLYDHSVSDLQFDSRKVIACCGENPLKIFNRTTQQTSLLNTNGHTQPVNKLRYIDRYLVSGGGDSTVKIWAL